MAKNRLAIDGGKPAAPKLTPKPPKHDLAEWKAIRSVFERGEIAMARGPEVMKLREKFCKLFGLKHAVTTSSGTAALHTAMGALEIGRGDEVITSPVTDMGTLVAILEQNAVPVFADIDPLTQSITPATVKKAITPRTRAIMPVHLAGYPCDVKGIKRVIKGRKIYIVEDMAQSYLTTQGKTLCGTIGDIGCWSLNESKHIGAGDGGVLLMNDAKLARRADFFADKCYNRYNDTRACFFAPFNYRLNNLAAAVCLEQMKKLKKICAARNKSGRKLDALLSKIPGITPRPVRKGDYCTYWYYIFNYDPKVIRVSGEKFRAALAAEGLGVAPPSGVLEWPIFTDTPDDRHACSLHCPHYKGKVKYNLKNFPGYVRAKETSLRTALHEGTTDADVKAIAAAIRKVAEHYA